MPRLRRLVRTAKVFFVTTNLQRGWPQLAPTERDLLGGTIDTVRRRRGFRLAGFVVMPDHLHLLVLPASGDTISGIVQELKHSAGRRINAVRGGKGTFWQKGFFDRFMRTPKELSETLDYMHKNPVRKGLVTTAEQWRWSSASAYAGRPSILAVDFLDLPAESEKPFR